MKCVSKCIYTLFSDSVLLIADTVFRADLRGIWELVSVGLYEDSSVEIWKKNCLLDRFISKVYY